MKNRCSRRKGSGRCGTRGVIENVLREREKPLRQASCLASMSVRPCLFEVAPQWDIP